MVFNFFKKNRASKQHNRLKNSYAGPQKQDVSPDYFEPMEGFRDLVDFHDNRTPVADSRQAPYRSICLIQAFDRGVGQAQMSGTGFLINANTVLTAAHVVFDNKRIRHTGSGKAETVSLWFGFDQKFGEPTGIYNMQKSDAITVHERYSHDRHAAFDIAIIQLEDPVGDQLGWLTPHIIEDTKLEQSEILISGYPGETEKRYTPYEHRAIISTVREQHFYHKVDTSEGQSGAPVIIHEENKRHIVTGIHSRGAARAIDDTGEEHNYAVRFRTELFDWIKLNLN